MTRKVMLILSLVSAVGLGWIVFRNAAPSPTLLTIAFFVSLAVFLGSVIAECRGAIARSTHGNRALPRDPHDPFASTRSRLNDDTARARRSHQSPNTHGEDRSEYRGGERLTG